MNVRWDDQVLRQRCEQLGLLGGQRISSLSGGQRAQLALALALAKRPRLLLLDEPVASLDPLARRTFLQTLMTAVADDELTVVFSTHLLDDLERSCDHLVLLAGGTLRLAEPIEHILRRHVVLVGPPDRPLPSGVRPIGGDGATTGRHQQLVSVEHPVVDPSWRQLQANLEEIVLAHLCTDPVPTRRLEVV